MCSRTGHWISLVVWTASAFAPSLAHADTVGIWEEGVPMPSPRDHSAVAASRGYIYSFGGFSNEPRGTYMDTTYRYDVASRAWVELRKMPEPRVAAAAVATPDGFVYVIGGEVTREKPGPTDSVLRYDPSTDTWTRLPERLQAARWLLRAVVDQRGGIYALGGEDGSRSLGSVEYRDPTTGVWRYVKPMRTARGYHGAARLKDGTIYVVGGTTGYSEGRTHTLSVEQYSPTTDTWTDVAPIPRPNLTWQQTTAGPDDLIYVVNGWDSSWIIETSIYDPASNTWRKGTAPVGPRSNGGLVAVRDSLYLVGGQASPNWGTRTVESIRTTGMSADELKRVGSVPEPAFDIELVGGFAYVTDESYGLKVIDVRDPAHPVVVGRCPASLTNSVSVAGAYAYVAEFTNGLKVVDVSDPTAPRVVGQYSGYAARDVAVSGHYAYIAARWDAGLQVIDVADPTAPRRVGGVSTPGSGAYAGYVEVQGSRVYLSVAGAGLQIFDVTSPTQPVRLGTWFAPYSADSFRVVGDLLYVTDNHSGLYIVDVSDPTNPRTLGSVVTQYPLDVEVVDGIAFVTDYREGLVLVDVADPEHPSRTGLMAVPSSAQILKAHGGYLYVGCRHQSLEIYAMRLHPPTISIIEPVEGAVVGSDAVQVALTVSDASPTTIRSVPAGLTGSLPAGGGTLSGTVPVPAEGENTITVVANDGTNDGATSVGIVRDTTPPSVNVHWPEGPVGSSPVDLVIEVTDATATTVTCAGQTFVLSAGGGVVVCSVPLTEGANSVSVGATDAAGNSTTAGGGSGGGGAPPVVLDSSAPVVEITSPSDGACFGPGEEGIPVVAAVDDVSATTVYSTPTGVSADLPRGGGVAAGALHLTGDGLQTITVAARDEVGRVGSDAVTVRLDTTPPDVAFVTPRSGDPVRGTIEIYVSATDAGCGVSRVELFLDGELRPGFEAGTNGHLLDTTALADGPHVLRAVAADGVDNVASAEIPILVDNTRPTVEILSPADGALVGGTVPFRVYVADETTGVADAKLTAAGIAPTVDPSGPLVPPAGSLTLEGAEDTTRWPDRELALAATVRDAAGNETTATATVTTDNTNPALVCISPGDGAIVTGIVRIEATASDEHLARFEIFVDGISVATSTTSPLAVDLDTRIRFDGAMTIRAVARDAVGNEAACSCTVAVDNMSFELVPATLNLRARGSDGPVMASLTGPNLALFLPTESHAIELRVPGGTAVRAVTGWDGDDALSGPQGDSLSVRFPRAGLVASIQAGLDAGVIPAGADLVPVTLYADGFEIGTAQLRIGRGR